MSERDLPPAEHVAVVGPTAAGKSALALDLARAAGAEIVSVDSMQVYRGMDIGTAKPSAVERAEVPHHLVDIADPADDFSVAAFQQAARDVIADIERRGRRAVLVGGTGLYHRAVIDDLEIPGRWPDVRAGIEADPDTAALHGYLADLDPAAAARMQPTNRRRIVRALEVTLGSGRPFSSFGPGLDAYPPTRFRQIGLELGRDELDHRIAERFSAMLDDGLLGEVRALVTRPAGLSRTARQALGYRELLDHLEGRRTLDEAVEEAVRRTRAFARRQQRWFRRDPRVAWIPAGPNSFAASRQLLGDWLGCA